MTFDKETTLGLYSPTFFKINLQNEHDIEGLFKGEISVVGESVFVHEYIHFLQDITTNSGLSNICRTVDYLKNINNLAKSQKEIEVPYFPENNDQYNIYANIELKKAYTGSFKINKQDADLLVVKEIYPSLKVLNLNGKKYDVNQCVINYSITKKNNEEIIKEYIVGEYAISESMAYCIESILYPNSFTIPNDYPYKVVNIVADVICPRFSEDPLRIIALCDASLMYYNPGEVLYDSLIYYRDINLAETTPEEIYDYIVSKYTINQDGCTNMIELFQKLSSNALKQTNDYFTGENYEYNKKWMASIFDFSIKLRTEVKYFMIDIARFGSLQSNCILNMIINSIGCPVVLNDKMDILAPIVRADINISKIDPSCFWSINQIYSIFCKDGVLKENTYRCEMIDWCKMSFMENGVEDLTSKGDSCLFAPWERALNEEERKYCSFAHIWYSWNMKGLKPINRQS